jgi:hypothetical protein
MLCPEPPTGEDMTLDPLHSDPKWKRRVLETTQANLKAQCEQLRFVVEEGAQNRLDVSGPRAQLGACEKELAKVEEDLRNLGGK